MHYDVKHTWKDIIAVIYIYAVQRKSFYNKLSFTRDFLFGCLSIS